MKPQKTPPISVENEKKTLNVIQKLCLKSLQNYRTKLQVKKRDFYCFKSIIKEDKALLEKGQLTYNQTNSTLLISGEKEVHFI